MSDSNGYVTDSGSGSFENMQFPPCKILFAAARVDEMSSSSGRIQASREIAQLTLRSVACGRDRDHYRQRLSQLEIEHHQIKHDNEQLLQKISMEKQTSKTLQEENRQLRQQLSHPQQDHRQLSICRSECAARNHRLWQQLVELTSHIEPSLGELPEHELADSVVEVVANLVDELSTARTDIRDLTYKTKHLEAECTSTSKEVAGLKAKLGQGRAQQCMSLACILALKQKMSKQRLLISNVEEAMRRMKTVQKIQETRQNDSSRTKAMAVLEGEQVLQDRLFALNKFLDIFAGNEKRGE